MNLRVLMSISAFVTFGVTTVFANPVNISWSDPSEYRDLRSTIETKEKLQHRFFKEINAHMNDLSQQLPAGYKLSLDVYQVDLAGRIETVHSQRIRVVKDMYYPNMAFNFKLVDKSGQLVLTDKAKIKGRNFLLNTSMRSINESFKYEKKMLSDWFEKDLLTRVIDKE